MRPPVWIAVASLLAAGALFGAGASAAPGSGTTSSPAQPAPAVPFEDWLAVLRKDAIARGITERTVKQALDGVERLPIVVERDRTQTELTLTLDEYLKRRLPSRFVTTAREMARTHRQLLARVTKRYGVPASVVVAIWGLESSFGRFPGLRPTIPALVTLAYDPRRPTLFREELFSALEILDRGEVDPDALKGSWAGAMGQPQFMPSSYLRLAVDFNGDGKRDIWRSTPDVLASIANYLRVHGWAPDVRWGREVRLDGPAAAGAASAVPLRGVGACDAERNMTEPRPLGEWRALGVRLVDGGLLPDSHIAASLVRVDRHRFLVYGNYETLLAYNCAHTYSLSVAILADKIAGR